MNVLLIFITGLTTGGLTCLAMQGGLLAGVIANQHQNADQQQTLRATIGPVSLFLLSKLIAHSILGALLGALGSVISLSLGVRLTFQVFAAFFMFATAMNLLHAHPWFRFVTFQPPRALQRLVAKSSRAKTLFAPAVLGALTIFIPCGVTQAMEVLAINSGDPLRGTAIMAAFVLGTIPLFALIGIATSSFLSEWQDRFAKIAAAILIAMAVYSVNGVLVVLDAPVTLQKIVAPVQYFFSEERFQHSATIQADNGIQKVTIKVGDYGYAPNRFQVRSGQPVELTLESKDTYSCALAFVFKEFGINTFLDSTDTQTFTFTPTKPGTYRFSCAMGMYTGSMTVL